MQILISMQAHSQKMNLPCIWLLSSSVNLHHHNLHNHDWIFQQKKAPGFFPTIPWKRWLLILANCLIITTRLVWLLSLLLEFRVLWVTYSDRCHAKSSLSLNFFAEKPHRYHLHYFHYSLFHLVCHNCIILLPYHNFNYHSCHSCYN